MSEPSSSYPSRVCPPPSSAMLPPPVPTRSPASSSSSHSSRKRKRCEVGGSVASSIASSASSNTRFSKRTKQKVMDLTGGKCWHCGATPVDVCHVIGQRDSSFGKFLDKGLITFESLEDEANAVPLCPLCHRNFDSLDDPGLVFIPTDIQYFIDFENRDFEGRKRSAALHAYAPPRQTPTPQEYLGHQIKQAAIPPDALGGLYNRYTLRDYFPVRMDRSFIPGPGPSPEPGMWHGAPMAALKRAFQTVFSPTVEGIPEETHRALYELSRLYKRNVEIGEHSTTNNSEDRPAGSEEFAQPHNPTSSSAAASASGGEHASFTTNAIENQLPQGRSTQAALPGYEPAPEPHRIAPTPEPQEDASSPILLLDFLNRVIDHGNQVPTVDS
ncbi:hypothetical protein LTR28_004294 [Elasticomyces elasticus]|nr:hypothetical protein LTR28_004294 [Elasticomyces elasticus]